VATIRFIGAPGSGIQFRGQTYAPGAVLDVEPAWAAQFIRDGRAVAVAVPLTEARVAEPEVGHRDPVLRRKR